VPSPAYWSSSHEIRQSRNISRNLFPHLFSCVDPRSLPSSPPIFWSAKRVRLFVRIVITLLRVVRYAIAAAATVFSREYATSGP
jgi:hypothetical protein